MAIRTNAKDISVHIDPLSIMANVEVIAGNKVQTYNKETKEYEPDRTLVPCVLLPSVSAVDPEGVINGVQDLTACEWYEGGTKIVNGDDYVISEPGAPIYSLTIKKNVTPDNPIEIRAVFTFNDKRRARVVTMERSLVLYTAMYDEANYSVKLTNQPHSFTIDPLLVKPNAQGQWLETISAQLYSGKDAVPDGNAAYFWEIYDYETRIWRPISADEYDTAIFGKSGGRWTKNLKFDARFFEKVSFRCRACFYATGDPYPASPKSEELQVNCSVKIGLQKTLRAEIRQLAGARINSQMMTPVKFECVITNRGVRIPEDKNDLFSVQWIAESGKPGSQAVAVGSGMTIEFIPKDLNFDVNHVMSIHSEVSIYKVHCLLVNAQSKAIKNAAGKLILSPKYV